MNTDVSMFDTYFFIGNTFRNNVKSINMQS